MMSRALIRRAGQFRSQQWFQNSTLVSVPNNVLVACLPASITTTRRPDSTGILLSFGIPGSSRFYSETTSPSATSESTTTSSPGQPAKTGRPRKPASQKKTAKESGPAKRTRQRLLRNGSITNNDDAVASTTPVPKKKRAAKKKSIAKKKPAAKKKSATKKKPTSRAKKPISPALVQRRKAQELRKVALLHGPKLLPSSSWLAYLTERGFPVGSKAVDVIRQSSNDYKALPLSEKQHYENIARENRSVNAKTYQDWVERHTPDAIREANNARRRLNLMAKIPKPEGAVYSLVKGKVNLIKDHRGVKKPASPYLAFVRDRWSSGDFKGVNLTEVAKTLSTEWKEVSEADKERYRDLFNSHKEQYRKDYDAIFTRGKRSPPTTPVT